MNHLEQLSQQLEQQGVSAEVLKKWRCLVDHLSSLGSAAVAYSGGVDSTFLAYTAQLVLGDRMCAVFLQSEVMAEDQITLADKWAALSGFKYIKLRHEVLKDEKFIANPVNRCYVCKLGVLGQIQVFANENGYQYVIEGQNADDLQDYRPGKAAVQETGTLSPLLDADLTKNEIRTLAHALGLPVWDQPSSPCLATRIPYGQQITADDLKRVNKAETFLRELGFTDVRVRLHQSLARIEVQPDQRQRVLVEADKILAEFKSIGFLHTTLDLQGYRRGSLNEGVTS